MSQHQPLRKIEGAILIAGLLSIGIVSYSLFLMSNTIRHLLPLIQISNDLKEKVSAAHLWFEEAMDNDPTIDLQRDVYQNIETARHLVRSQGDQMRQIDPQLYESSRKPLQDLEAALAQWQRQTEERWNHRAASVAGSISDQMYDASFQRILELCEENQRIMDAVVSQRQKVLNRMNTGFIIFLALVFSTITYAAWRYRQNIESKNLAVMKLSQAVEQTEDIISITDKDGVIEYVNPAFEKFTGYASDEAVGRKASILKSGAHSQQFYEDLWENILSGKVFRSEIINRKKNGDLYIEEKTISPIRNAEGVITHYVSTAKEITERKRIEKELAHSREMKIIGQLASGVAHEVRNPLNAIQAVSEAMFQNSVDHPEHREYLSHIRVQVKRLSELMRDLLELGKPVPAASMQPTDLLTLCEGSIQVWTQYESCAHLPQLLLSPNSTAIIKVNPIKMQQVFINLLDNAAQHSPEGGEIRFILHQPSNGQVRISIHDQGPGVENPNQVFEPFFTTRVGGTGLGLTIVKQIVEAHGGSISISNNDPPPGCAVHVVLPLAKDELQ